MKVAWLFPGQGAQAVGMGKEVFEASAAARAVFEQADAALGETISQLCFEGPIEQLTLTRNTQPALVATSAALVAALRERYPSLSPPAYVAGHSLGEYSALVAAGALPLADAVRVCRVRGDAMQQAVAPGLGKMAAVMKLDGTEVAALCASVSEDGAQVSAANFNAPTQTVVAGHAVAVERLSEAAKGQGARVIPLNVSAPFHCGLMAPAREPVAQALAQSDVVTSSCPVVANVDAQPHTSPEAFRNGLCEQIDNPVRWVQSIRFLREQGVTHALEIGPGRVLAGLAKRIDKGLSVLGVSDLSSLEKVKEFLSL